MHDPLFIQYDIPGSPIGPIGIVGNGSLPGAAIVTQGNRQSPGLKQLDGLAVGVIVKIAKGSLDGQQHNIRIAVKLVLHGLQFRQTLVAN